LQLARWRLSRTAMPPKAAAPVELPAPLPTDVPAGGLDVPIAAPTLNSEEAVEAFPGEFQLAPDERTRWLVLHFALPRTIMTADMAEGRSTEAELNDVLSGMAWGSIDADTSEWVLESEDPSLEPPHPSLISYTEYVARAYPSDDAMEEEARAENVSMAAQKRVAFTSPGEPGAKFRPMFDQMVKNLSHTNKALMRAYDIKKPLLNEEALPEDPARSDAQNIMRFGRHQVLPSFWQLLVQLVKKGRRFSLVLHSFQEDQLAVVQRELQLFCQGQHPAYDGKNKTQKPPPMSGDKGSRDLRLLDGCIGRVDRTAGRLEFAGRPAGDAPKTARPGEVASVAPAAAPAASPAPGAGAAGGAEPGAAGDGEGGAEEDATAPEPEPLEPTVYNFPPYHEVYAGLQHQVLDGANAAAIIDDVQYWKSQGQEPTAGKMLLVDHGSGLAETKVQHIFFDGTVRQSVDVRDVVSGRPIPPEEAEGLYTHQVDLFQAAVDVDYFVRATDACELKFSQRILESRGAVVGEDGAAADKAAASSDALPPKEYLYKNVIPALLPALEACQRDRPADPIEFIAMYMLRHPRQYSKTLKG